MERTEPQQSEAADGDIKMLLEAIVRRLDRLDERMALSTVKESYTTDEVAHRLGRSGWTVRQWCNQGQVNDVKKVRGKGRTGEWRIPHDEMARLQSEGPLPPGTCATHRRAS